jgi:hypothetical protein
LTNPEPEHIFKPLLNKAERQHMYLSNRCYSIIDIKKALIIVFLVGYGFLTQNLYCQNLIETKESSSSSETIFPEKEWLSKPPEDFGFSANKLDEVKTYFEDIGGDACIVVKSGYIIAEWGKVAKTIPNYSIRKSYLSSLLGIEYGLGKLNLNSSLKDLNIDDISGLTENEKKAKIKNLLSSTSGVFHEAAHESKEQEGARPPRGSFKPGTFFYYNNWDFNTIGHIYSLISKEDLFESFNKKIASKIKMQDYKMENTAYEYESSSNYPAYLFETSARDDARLGYLFLRNGKWKHEQIIPEKWINMSFTNQVTTGKYWYYDYGYLWWVDSKNEQYFARGNSGQYIAILPKEDMIIVFRSDPGSIFRKWLGLRVKPQESFLLIPKILEAKIGI